MRLIYVSIYINRKNKKKSKIKISMMNRIILYLFSLLDRTFSEAFRKKKCTLPLWFNVYIIFSIRLSIILSLKFIINKTHNFFILFFLIHFNLCRLVFEKLDFKFWYWVNLSLRHNSFSAHKLNKLIKFFIKILNIFSIILI